MKLGIIGFGHRIQHVLKVLIKHEPACRVAAIVDPLGEELKVKSGKDAVGIDLTETVLYDSPEAMLENAELDGVLIGTRCNLHTEMALKVFKAGVPLFLEKPVATTFDDLLRLKAGYEANRVPVIVSFPLRNSPMIAMVKEIIDSGKIGSVEHIQAVNNVPYGGVYYHNWYRDESITGGLFLQKATHDFDYINLLAGQNPKEVCAMTSKQIFKGNKPAGLRCIDCDEKYTCSESVILNNNGIDQDFLGGYCSFAEDTGNEDSGSALIRYPSGMHVSYSQNFFARRGAARRGATLIGYKGTLEFDWYTNEIVVHMHHTAREERYKLNQDMNEGHSGGDDVLVRNFIGVMKRIETSQTPLEQGMLSALLCLKAKKSAETGTFQTVDWEYAYE